MIPVYNLINRFSKSIYQRGDEMIVVPMNSFPPEEIQKKGQIFFCKKVLESGTEAVEIRKELLTTLDWPLEQFRTERYTVYSAPVDLFDRAGNLNQKELKGAIQEMKQMQANTLKLPLGHFKREYSNVVEMNAFFRTELAPETDWLIENDQTEWGGKIKPITQFFMVCREASIDAGLTFDTGNWLYTGERMEEAFRVLKESIRYLHLKHVEETAGGLKTVAIPLDGKADWEKVMSALPENIPLALEFPLSLEEIPLFKNYIEKKEGVVK